MIDGAVYLENGRCLLSQVHRTTNAIERARGLLGREKLDNGEALLLDFCSSVHTIGMKYSLDLVFLWETGQIKKLVHRLPPWRMVASLGARMTLEMLPGSLETYGIKRGMVLHWRRNG